MSEITGISWADSTWNPWHGCTKVSPGCKYCYAESWRFKKAAWGPTAPRVRTSKVYWREPLKWNKADWMECKTCGWRGDFIETIAAGTRHVCPKCEGELKFTKRRVFPSMCDPFEDNNQVANWRGEMFKLIEQTPNIDWLLLTKRPENIFSLGTDAVGEVWDLWLARHPNVWLGASVESQEYFEQRVAALVQNGAGAVLFLSVEPMIGPVRLIPTQVTQSWWQFVPGNKTKIDWVICGGESGAGCRPMNMQWARDLRDDCETWGVKFFMKQLGGFPNKRDRLDDLPMDLKVREVPVV